MARTYPVVPHTVFGGSAAAAVNGSAQFGSKQTGTPVYSNNIATIQALAAWLQGWAGAVVQGKVPPLEELNAAFLEPSYQIASLFECGVPDWNAGITYSTNSLVQSGGQLYISLQDNNLNNAISNTAWWQIFSLGSSKGDNVIRNGGMAVAQRGTSGTITAGSPAYSLDGWIIGCLGANVTWAQDNNPFDLSITGATSNTDIFLKQRVESYVCGASFLPADYITFQCVISNNTSGPLTPTLAVNYANAEDNFSAVSGILGATNLQTIPGSSTATVSYTFKLANISGFANGMEFILDFGAIGHLNSVTVSRVDVSRTPKLTGTGLQSNPPEAEIRPMGVEVVNCQRYLNVLGGDQSSQFVASGITTSTTTATFFFLLPKMIGILPLATYSNVADFQVFDPLSTAPATTNMSQTSNESSSMGLAIQATVAAGLTSGHFVYLIMGSTNSRIFVSAEL